MGGAHAMGALAARHHHSTVPLLLLWRARDLPAAGRARRQRRGTGRRPGLVAGLHAGIHHALLAAPPGGCSGGGRRFSPPPCSPCSARRCTWVPLLPSDALGVLLIALAAWCVLTAGARGRAVGRMVVAGAALALATAADYSSVLYDVVVPVIAVLAAAPLVGVRAALHRLTILLRTLAVLLASAAVIGGGAYFTGFQRTILAPAAHTSSPVAVLASSWRWGGLLVLLALGGVILSWGGRQGRAQTWLLAVLTCAALLGPAEQAWLQTQAVLNQHVGMGAWFAAIAAGYAVARFMRFARPGRDETLTAMACVAALAFPVSLGAAQSWQLATSWPNATSFIDVLRPLADRGNGRLLVEDPTVARYYLQSGTEWRRWSSTRNIVRPSGASTGTPSRRRHRRPRQRGRPPQIHRPGLLLLCGLEFRRHHHTGPRPGHRDSSQPPLPPNGGRSVWHREQGRQPGHLHHLAVPATSRSPPAQGGCSRLTS